MDTQRSVLKSFFFITKYLSFLFAFLFIGIVLGIVFGNVTENDTIVTSFHYFGNILFVTL